MTIYRKRDIIYTESEVSGDRRYKRKARISSLHSNDDGSHRKAIKSKKMGKKKAPQTLQAWQARKKISEAGSGSRKTPNP